MRIIVIDQEKVVTLQAGTIKDLVFVLETLKVSAVDDLIVKMKGGSNEKANKG